MAAHVQGEFRPCIWAGELGVGPHRAQPPGVVGSLQGSRTAQVLVVQRAACTWLALRCMCSAQAASLMMQSRPHPPRHRKTGWRCGRGRWPAQRRGACARSRRASHPAGACSPAKRRSAARLPSRTAWSRPRPAMHAPCCSVNSGRYSKVQFELFWIIITSPA